MANDGNNLDRFGDMRFGDDGPGDIYERLLIATKPFASSAGRARDIVLGIGGDLVFSRRARRSHPGRHRRPSPSYLALAATKRAGQRWLGGYAVYRQQRTADDGDVYSDDNVLVVGAFNLAGQGTLWFRKNLQLVGAFESTLITGNTSVLRDSEGTHRVLQGGAVGRAFVGDHSRWLAGADVGYASGDPNPSDRWSQQLYVRHRPQRGARTI